MYFKTSPFQFVVVLLFHVTAPCSLLFLRCVVFWSSKYTSKVPQDITIQKTKICFTSPWQPQNITYYFFPQCRFLHMRKLWNNKTVWSTVNMAQYYILYIIIDSCTICFGVSLSRGRICCRDGTPNVKYPILKTKWTSVKPCGSIFKLVS
jgi:hypothetical protein